MALEQFNLDGQVAIVTGAGKGVGQASRRSSRRRSDRVAREATGGHVTARKGVGKASRRVLAEAGATVVGTARRNPTSSQRSRASKRPAAGGTRSSPTPSAVRTVSASSVATSAASTSSSTTSAARPMRGFSTSPTRFQAHLRLVRDIGVHHESATSLDTHLNDRRHVLGRRAHHGFGERFRARLTAYCVAEGRAASCASHPRHGAGTGAEDPGQRDRPRLVRDRRAAGRAGHDVPVQERRWRRRLNALHRLGDVEDLSTDFASDCASTCATKDC